MQPMRFRKANPLASLKMSNQCPDLFSVYDLLPPGVTPKLLWQPSLRPYCTM